jgi:hypothetical protein
MADLERLRALLAVAAVAWPSEFWATLDRATWTDDTASIDLRREPLFQYARGPYDFRCWSLRVMPSTTWRCAPSDESAVWFTARVDIPALIARLEHGEHAKTGAAGRQTPTSAPPEPRCGRCGALVSQDQC